MSKVSCIVSAYYAEQYINTRLDNLLSQGGDIEVIVVCRRGSAEHLAACAYPPELVTVIITEDVPTIYSAWNMAVEAATGDYITNANCDDYLYPGALEKLAQALDEHPKFIAVYSDTDVIQEPGGLPTGRYEWIDGGLPELLEGCFLGPWPMWRKKAHQKHGLFDGEMQSAGDYEFWLRLAKAGEKFFHVKEVTGAYLYRENSAEHRASLRSLWEQARAKGRYRKGATPLWTEPEVMTD